MNTLIMLYMGSILLTAGFFGYAIVWAVAWMNQLALFVMQIYKNETARLPPQYAFMTGILFGLSALFLLVSKLLLTLM
jgi:hypothetical protein